MLAMVERFCPLSGFKLNKEMTEILTFAALPPPLVQYVVPTSRPTKALGLLVAPDLAPHARFDYVFKRFLERLLLWSHRAHTLVGKVVILQAVCLPLLWYQLAYVAPVKSQADKIDRAMLQFLHNEPITGIPAKHFRSISQDVVFLPKAQAGLGLVRAMETWTTRLKALMLRVVQATSTPDGNIPAWTQPGVALLSHHYHPWGTFTDLLFADGNLVTIKKLLDDPQLPRRWKPMLNEWFHCRVAAWPRPWTNNAMIEHQAVWHNALLPAAVAVGQLQVGYNRRYALQVAGLGYTHVNQLQPTPTLAEGLVAAIIRRSPFRRLSKKFRDWTKVLAGIAHALGAGCQPTEQPPPTKDVQHPRWLVQLRGRTLLLASAPRQWFCRPPRHKGQQSPMKTNHLMLAPDHYTAPEHVAAAAALRQPKHIHPKYSDSVYRVVLGALALRYRLSRFMDVPATCLFCTAPETYEHLLLDCIYMQDTWNSLQPLTSALGLQRPTTLSGILFDNYQ
ncbi:hypothetical protein ACHHYP_09149 [Achlya hypogyna]|uniref:Reverse transcriptase zinc-binding domain-containing protein n=1 Tax=Achlya hypogyna TaxID=1202772 RepID=A0A1V9ZJF5_ACHHY|nr:hypothetical protein ACHHYP_09149 [Achlya hypogyna]